jgi:superfamily II DNA or RNA helicase/HKD family nuclease
LPNVEAADRIALHVSRIIEQSVAELPESDRTTMGIHLARELIQQLAELIGQDGESDRQSGLRRALPLATGDVLQAVLPRNLDGSPHSLEQPLTPLLDTTLLTNARSEPSLGKQLRSEIPSADRIDAIVAFVRYSGLRPMLDALRRHCENGRPLRLLTTTYTGSTEAKALDALRNLGANVRVSYDTTTTRLHAKSWSFHRDTGTSTAYIGSSNLTHSAQVPGLEWNLRVSGRRNPAVLAKMVALFESYWEGGDFVEYDPEVFAAQMDRTHTGPQILLSPVELRPEPFQQRLLEQIEVSRELGYHRNLLVSATGTGKTVMAALDYAGLRSRLPRARLLFVAHRSEILQQSLATFRYAMRDPAFGELWVGGKKPTRFEHVFASIQSLSAAGISQMDPSHFDVVIIDEFHHAAADSYDALLQHLRPHELLGMTATPERPDGMPILHWFGDRIAAELRLWDAIDQQRLVPFQYYGLHDGTDLSNLPWKRGRGYEVTALENVYTADDAWCRRIIHQLNTHVDDVRSMRALGFCVSVSHARFMADRFSSAGISAVAVSAQTPTAERKAALRNLAEGRIQAVFSVDLFNEGVDVPAVDTILMLRPTESATVFLQQLGRGLRRNSKTGKATCTVLDFVGQHRKEFRFDRKLGALLGGTRKDLQRQITNDFPYLPAGCSLELDPVARDIILRSLKEAIPSTWPARVAELRRVVDAGHAATLPGYLDHSGLDLSDVYANNRSWSVLLEAAELPVQPAGPYEQTLRRAVGRMLHIDDQLRLVTYQRLVGQGSAPQVTELTASDHALLRMLIVSLTDQVLGKREFREVDLQVATDLLWQHPQVLAEIAELLPILLDRVDHVHSRVPGRPDIPLNVHARYTRLEILAAMGQRDDRAKTPTWREGVRWAKDKHADLFLITLDKSPDHFSPTTRYRDYAISQDLFHWESQSITSADSPTGRRYRDHSAIGSAIYLFARNDNTSNAFWFLGPATYVRHDGDRPMGVTWRLETPLPGDLYAEFAAAAVA